MLPSLDDSVFTYDTLYNPLMLRNDDGIWGQMNGDFLGVGQANDRDKFFALGNGEGKFESAKVLQNGYTMPIDNVLLRAGCQQLGHLYHLVSGDTLLFCSDGHDNLHGIRALL